MPKMHELLTQEQIEALVPQLSAELLEHAMKRKDQGVPKDTWFTFTKGSERDEKLEGVARWVAAQMVLEGKPFPKPRSGYTHEWTGNLTTIYRRLDLDGYIETQQIYAAVTQLTRFMKRHQIIHRPGSAQVWWVRQWPETLQMGPQHRDGTTVVLEAERQQARHPEEPVTLSHSLRNIRPMPQAPTANEVIAYVERLVLAFNNLESEYQRIQRENNDLSFQLREMTDALEELRGGDWQQAAFRIQALIADEEQPTKETS